ncbi:MAG: hypothetical protein ACT6U0_20000 [Shinella sp.]|uniref:hypothetical protein n=1 Tax=Shinella sp. TaxID=1870904 RepID=UPI004035163E
MNDWFRSWHGAPTDPKWLGIAKRAGVAPGIAVAVAWALMDRASQSSDRGSIEGYDAEGLAYFYGCEPEQVEAIVAAMTDKGMIAGGRFSSWEKRQPKREDGAAERAKEWRERKRTQTNASATLDTDAETDTSSLRSEVEKKERERKDFDSWISSWPSQASDDHDDAFRAWSELPDEERAAAKGLSSAYAEQAKGGGRTVICSAAKYLRKQMWTRVQSKPPEKPPKAGPKVPSREAYIAAELRRSERSFQR